MDDGSSSILKSLRNDWALLWGNFLNQTSSNPLEEKSENSLDDDSNGAADVAASKVAADENLAANSEIDSDDMRGITAEELAIVARVLSQRRKQLNQKLESLNREIEDNNAKLETIRLVGGEDEMVLNRISVLTDLGLKVNNDLAKLDEKLSFARKREQELMQEFLEE